MDFLSVYISKRLKIKRIHTVLLDLFINFIGELNKIDDMENSSVSFYDKWLRETPTQPTTVTSLSEYFNAITAINKVFPRNLFRGQADEQWKIESSACRCLTKPTVERLRDYHKKLVSEIIGLRDCELYEGLEMV